ncbi:MAG: cell division/cell wall cluster transcriptional repressor MraZ, partial [Pseudomonadota bacterium]
MGLFLSTSKHKIDRKGRVSVPAGFRAALQGEAAPGVALMRPLSDQPCLEGSGLGRVHGLAAALARMNPISEERDAIATAILADVHLANFDAEGRVVLPEELMRAAELEGEALFAGLGDKFQIWRPERFDAWRAEA